MDHITSKKGNGLLCKSNVFQSNQWSCFVNEMMSNQGHGFA